MSTAEKEVGALQNFRSNYYHKLGSTSAVEEKKSLQKLLNIVPLDIKKLEQFCHHLHVPYEFRCELWKILLKISPIYQSTHEYVAMQRLQHFKELERVVRVMQMTSSEDEETDLSVYIAMYLIENRTSFAIDIDHISELDEAKHFGDIVNAVGRMDFNPCDTYWISRNFTNMVRLKIHPDIPNLIKKTHLHLQREDISGKLCEHLRQVDAFDKIPYREWFSNSFAKVLPETIFDRVWDKVISGSSVVLVFIAVAMLLINRKAILVVKTPHDVLNIFTQIKTVTAEEVVRKGIELWQRNGGKLTPSSARASPALNSERTPTPPTFQPSQLN